MSNLADASKLKEHDDNEDTQDNEIVNAVLDDNRNGDDSDDDNREDEVDNNI